MIQVYKRNNENFDVNGDMVLTPASCEITAELNGAWQLKLVHPFDMEGRWKYLEEEGVLAVPSFVSDKQLFRIRALEKRDTEVAVVAYPIFFDSRDDCFLMDVRPTDKGGQAALDILMEGSKYSGRTNIQAEHTAYYIRKNLMEAISGDDENAFIHRWGGEILYDNFTVIVNDQVGADHGLEVRYGKNIAGIRYSVDFTDVITRIVPVAYNGYTLDGTAPWVDSDKTGRYAKLYTKVVKFEDVKLKDDVTGTDKEGFNTLEALQAELIRRSRQMFKEGTDEPAVTIEVDMVDLADTEEYAGYRPLLQAGLGDMVRCRHEVLDITTTARVIKIAWDCITNTCSGLTLGDYEYNYFNDMSSIAGRVEKAISEMGAVQAGNVEGIIDCLKTKLRAQKSIAQKQEVRAMLFEDLDPQSDTFGAMCLGTMGFEIASKRTADGRDWDWRTFGTGAGFAADCIVAGTMLADRILGGTLTLGGAQNGNGMARVLDASGRQCAALTKDGLEAIKGLIGGWNINQSAIYKDVMASDGTIYRVYFQPPLVSSPGKTWVLSCQQSTDGGAHFYGRFILFSDGSVRFGGTTITADGAIIINPEDGQAPVYIRMTGGNGGLDLQPTQIIFENSDSEKFQIVFTSEGGGIQFYNTAGENYSFNGGVLAAGLVMGSELCAQNGYTGTISSQNGTFTIRNGIVISKS